MVAHEQLAVVNAQPCMSWTEHGWAADSQQRSLLHQKQLALPVKSCTG